MAKLKRRTLLQASMGVLAAPQIMAQSKPEKLVYVGDNGPWHYVMVEEVAPAFEKATGIKVDFTLLPVDPWRARLRAELGAGSSGIDVFLVVGFDAGKRKGLVFRYFLQKMSVIGRGLGRNTTQPCNKDFHH